MTGRSSTTISALQRVAAIGLPSRVAFPELVSLLREAVPFDTASMLWLDADFRPIDAYLTVENSPEIAARYASRWFNADEARFYPAQKEMQTDRSKGIVRVSDFTRDFREAEIYDEVFRPVRHHWIAGLALFNGPRPIGNLGLGRPPSMPDFSDAEMRWLNLARPYVIQALCREDRPSMLPDVDVEDGSAFLVCDPGGGVQHASPGAWRALQAAAGLRADLPFLQDGTHQWARPLLADLARRVTRAMSGGSGPPARLDIRNSYGRFVVRAYALDASIDEPPRAIAVQVETRLPLRLKMTRSPVFRRLTRREQEVAQQLATGRPYREIADDMGLGQSTVVSHVRNLGAKLNAVTREDMLRALSA